MATTHKLILKAQLLNTIEPLLSPDDDTPTYLVKKISLYNTHDDSVVVIFYVNGSTDADIMDVVYLEAGQSLTLNDAYPWIFNNGDVLSAKASVTEVVNTFIWGTEETA